MTSIGEQNVFAIDNENGNRGVRHLFCYLNSHSCLELHGTGPNIYQLWIEQLFFQEDFG